MLNGKTRSKIIHISATVCDFKKRGQGGNNIYGGLGNENQVPEKSEEEG